MTPSSVLGSLPRCPAVHTHGPQEEGWIREGGRRVDGAVRLWEPGPWGATPERAQDGEGRPERLEQGHPGGSPGAGV